MASPVANIFRQAAELTANDPLRNGSVVNLGSPGRVVIAGDIHGHRGNLTKILAHASAGGADKPVLILQEIIHGPQDPQSGLDRSIELLMRAARLKIASPDKVYFIMGNHDLAQFTGNEIAKEGRGVCKAFNEAIQASFGEHAGEIIDAANELFRSMPLAIRFDNGIMACHTLPSPKRAELAGMEILDRSYIEEDFKRGGPVYEWTWGRDQSPEQLQKLAEKLGVKFFILGHRHIQAGKMMLPHHAIAINCNTPQGCIAEFDTNSDLDISEENIDRYIKPVARL